jgi:RNA polymerase sigma factor (sigma-70 family)
VVLVRGELENLLRELTPSVLGVLVRRHGDFAACEDAVQEALLAAATQWPVSGMPDNPAGWLITVATRRRIEVWRSEAARRQRERTAALLEPDDREAAAAEDDTLILMLLCCHPLLSVPSQVALTLRAVGGLSTAEIARGFLVPEVTVGQRISRAKQKLRGARFGLPGPAELPGRVSAVRRVLYLIFNEGYTASSGPALHRAELTTEAIRLTRQLHSRLTGQRRAGLADDGETAGLLALMLLTEARRPARTRADGALVPLGEQDRHRWDARLISEGTELITRTLASAPVGPYQLQAAIAAVHDEAACAADTDWAQILVLYDHLTVLAPGPMVTLNRIVAVAMVHGPRLALHQLDDALAAAPALAGHHRLHAVRAHLLDLAGDTGAARELYRTAARMSLSVPERRYLESRAQAGVSGNAIM